MLSFRLRRISAPLRGRSLPLVSPVASALACAALTLLLASPLAADDVAAPDEPVAAAASEPEPVTLKYKFRPGEVLRWQVTHRARVRTTVQGTTQTAETLSRSVKVWRVLDVDTAAGTATFEYRVESVDMQHRLTGRDEVRYKSDEPGDPPAGFEDVARSVGVPLSRITLDTSGKIMVREKQQAGSSEEGQLTVPFPDRPIRVGETWSQPHDIVVTLEGGVNKTIQTRQDFTLTEVKGPIATITIETKVLTPVHDPQVEAQLVQRYTTGSVRFDIEAGRIVGQQMDLDKRVVGFSGEASSLHYETRFTEELLPPQPQTARQPAPAGPEPPKPQPRPSTSRSRTPQRRTR